MSVKFEPEYCITENLLLDFDNYHHVPYIYETGVIDLIKIFETNSKTLSLSMGEMYNNGVDPFEDLSDLYDLELEDE